MAGDDDVLADGDAEPDEVGGGDELLDELGGGVFDGVGVPGFVGLEVDGAGVVPPPPVPFVPLTVGEGVVAGGVGSSDVP